MTKSDNTKRNRKQTGKVCLLTSTFPRWQDDAIPGFVLDLATDLMAEGWQVDVLAPHCKGAATAEVMQGVAVTRFRYMWPAALQTLTYGEGGALSALRRRPWYILALPFYLLAQMIALYRLVRRRDVDLINSHWLLPQGLTAGIISWLTGIPHVATVHGGDVLGLKSGLFACAKRMALDRAQAATANSNVTEAAINELARAGLRIERIPLGANPPPACDPAELAKLRNRYAPDGGPLLLFVGRLIQQKGCEDLLAATAIVEKAHPDIRLLIAGDGPERGALGATARALNIETKVVFLGWATRDKLAHLYYAADIFVAAPIRGDGGEVEAFGLVFVEAALAGLPTVATCSGGIKDIVLDGETGLLVSENAPDALAAALTLLIDNPDRASLMGAAAKERAEAHFTRAGAARAFSELFIEVASLR